jgi:hypothetical protein
MTPSLLEHADTDKLQPGCSCSECKKKRHQLFDLRKESKNDWEHNQSLIDRIEAIKDCKKLIEQADDHIMEFIVLKEQLEARIQVIRGRRA